MDRFVVDSEPFSRAGWKILQKNIRLGGQGLDDLDPLGCFEIDRDASFIAVGAEKVGAFTGSGEGGAPVARLVANLRALHLDDVGSQVAEDHGAVRSR